jgi:3-isopropylmalate/(R)-2-methylmalate dehydratase small subunit
MTGLEMKGKVWKFGDDVNTDVIYPGKYLPIFEPEEMAKHVMEGLDPEFPGKISSGDIMVAGKYFGCGSSREQAATAIKHAGITAVIAKSFARIFYRNAINQGLPIIVCEETDKISEGDEVSIDLEGGTVKNLATGDEFKVKPLPPFLMEIINDGGLIPHLKKKMG